MGGIAGAPEGGLGFLAVDLLWMKEKRMCTIPGLGFFSLVESCSIPRKSELNIWNGPIS